MIRHRGLIGLLAVAVATAACAAPHGGRAAPATPPVPASMLPPTAVPSTALPTGAPSPAASPGGAPPVAPDAWQLLAGADPTDATAVAEVFARGSWAIDTTTEASEVDAEARLAALMTPGLAAEIEAATTSVQPDATFEVWRSHQSITTASIAANNDAGAPPDTPTMADRSFVITVTPKGRDGWVGPPITDVEFLSLTRPGPGGAWRIADVH